MNNDQFLDVLGARSGIVCAVGAAGKKSTLYRLLDVHPGHVAYTTTVFTYALPDDFPAHVVIGDRETVIDDALAAATAHRKVAYACPSDKPGRLAGIPPAQVARCHGAGGFDLTLVKADGARMCLLKAPAAHEPNLVPGATTVLGLLSARAVGMPLDARHVHRPEQVAAVTGASAGETLTARHLARLIAAPDGLRRGTAQARFIPVINMADSARHRAAAVEVARIALDLCDACDRVVVAAMRAADPIIEVVERP